MTIVTKNEKLAASQPEPKKAYTAPRLTRYGTIGELTKGGGGYLEDMTGAGPSGSF